MQGLWAKCEECDEILYRAEIEKNLNVCPQCGHHMPWPARARLAALLDEGTFEELRHASSSRPDPLGFTDSKKYRDRLKVTRKNLEENDAFIGGVGRIEGHPVSVGCFVFEFMGGSMGSVVGEKVTRVFERAVERSCPAIVFCASGGARMQEGIFSLMQMAKTSAAIARFREVRKPYISVMLHPTTGGVAASLRLAGRRHPRRAQGADRLRRAAGHRADHPPEAARGLPALGVPARARDDRRHRPAQGPPARSWGQLLGLMA